MRIKLAAVAKDEAAYLPEWLFHHLHFGFDEIEIVVNNSDDNSVEILERIARHYPVHFRDLGRTDPGRGHLQRDVYQSVWAAGGTATHLCFLDIDEFWTPFDFTESVHDCLNRLGLPDIVSFEWCLKRSDHERFGRPFQSANQLIKHRHVKSLFRVDLPVESVGVHNVQAPGARNVLADGQPSPAPYQAQLAKGSVRDTPIKRYFILHRFWRSEYEYIASLAQGMRQMLIADDDPQREALLALRNNRPGFVIPDVQCRDYGIATDRLAPYEQAYAQFVDRCGLHEPLARARVFREQRHAVAIAALRRFRPMQLAFVERAIAGLSEDSLSRIRA